MKANFTKASLIVPETRIVAGLMLDQASPAAWKQAIEDDNVLQKKSRLTALTYATLARSRLQAMSPPLWAIAKDGTRTEATDAALAATVKFSPLFGDFLRDVLRDAFRRFALALSPTAWDEYIDQALRAHPEVEPYNASTRVKLRQNAMRILQEAGFVLDTKSLTLRRRSIEPAVKRYLDDHNERYVLECLLICP
jgi:hypothetical protein